MDQLPPEVLAKIFIESLPERPVPSLSSPPLLLTTVCKSWRDVAEQHPQLWERIFIHFHVGLLNTSDRADALVRKGAAICRWLHLAPASTTFVSLSILNTTWCEEWEEPTWPQRYLVFDIMRPLLFRLCAPQFTNKWKTLVLSYVAEPYRSQVLNIPASELRSLRTLECKATKDHCSTVNKMTRTMLGKSTLLTAPALTSLHIQSLFPSLNLKDYPLANWNAMTELHVTPWSFWPGASGDPENGCMAWISISEVYTVLDRCKSTLISFAFTSVVPGDPTTDAASRTTHVPRTMAFPNLRHLSLRTKGVENLADCLALFKVPSLISLDIRDEGTHFAPSGGAVFALLQANPTITTQLETVGFKYDQLGPSRMESILELLGGSGTQVKHLSVVGTEPKNPGRSSGGALITRNLLDKLIPKFRLDDHDHEEGPPLPLFPCLETLHVIAPYSGEASAFDFADLIAGRITSWLEGRQGIAKLKTYHLKLFEEPSLDDFYNHLAIGIAELCDCPESVFDDVDIDFSPLY